MIYRIVILSIALSFASMAKANPSLVNMPIATSYVPIGFDDNDRVQIAIEGNFPNSCYRVGPYSAKVDAESQTVEITQQAYVYPDIYCLQMIVPFSQIINVGIVPEGNYRVVDAATKKVIGQLPVTHTNSPAADDFFYAPVNDAYITTDGPTPTTIVVKGSFSDRCTEFERIQVGVRNNTIVVQPITRRTSRENCVPEKTFFFKRVDLKEKLRGTYLLHVRSLDGQAVNKLLDIQ